VRYAREFTFLFALAACGGDGTSTPVVTGPPTFQLASKSASDTIEAVIPGAIQVSVLDAKGKPLSGAQVTLHVLPDRVLVTPGVVLVGATRDTVASAVTTASGTVRMDVALGTKPGTYGVGVSVAGVARQDTVNFSVLPGAPASMQFATHDTTMTVNAPYTPVVKVSDRKGNARADSVSLTSSTTTCRVTGGAVSASTVARCVVTARLGSATDTLTVTAVPQGRATVVVFQFNAQWVGTMNLDGSGLKLIRAISGNPFDAIHPWLGPNGILASMDVGADVKTHIMIVNADGSGQFVPVNLPIGAEENWPVFSPDGQWVFFSACQPMIFEHCRVWRTKLDGSQPTILSPSAQSTGQRTNWTDISPDGKTLLYAGPGERVHRLDLQTMADVDLGLNTGTFSFDPTGARFAYIVYDQPVTAPIVIRNLDGSGQRTLAPNAGTGFNGPIQWLPGGEWIYASTWIMGIGGTSVLGGRVLVNVNTNEIVPIKYNAIVNELWVVR